jgi:hypothetical protein
MPTIIFYSIAVRYRTKVFVTKEVKMQKLEEGVMNGWKS